MEKSSKEISREALYELVWSKPMFQISATLGVSASYLTRVCLRLKVPKPGRGYWARIAAGEVILKPSLPPAQPGDEIAWTQGGGSVTISQGLIQHRVDLVNPEAKIKKTPSGTHPVLIGMKAHFEAGKTEREYCYLKPSKRLLIDLLATRAFLDKALLFANKLFSTLDGCGYKVSIPTARENLRRISPKELEGSFQSFECRSIWYPIRPTVIYLGTMAIGLTIFEIFEEAEAYYNDGQYVKVNRTSFSGKGRPPWITEYISKKYFPTGKLCLHAYSPYPRVIWTRQWIEDNRGLKRQILEIIKDIENEAPKLLQLLNEAERQAEIERKEREAQYKIWQAEQERRLMEEAEREQKESLAQCRKELLQIINEWDEANRIERFFKEVEQKSISLDESDKQKVIDRLKVARRFIGSMDIFDHFKKWKTP